MEKRPPGPRSQGFRLTIVLPILLAIVGFILTLVVVLSGSKQGLLENAHTLTLNTSGVGQNLITFTPSSNSSSGSDDDDDGSLGGFLGGLLDNITSGITGGLNSAESDLIASVSGSLGMSEFYTFHLQNICQGSLSNTSDPDATFKVELCTGYSNQSAGLANITHTVPSSMSILGTNVTVPLLNSVGDSTAYLNSMASKLGRTTFALFILSLIGTGLSIPLALIAAFKPSSGLFNMGSLFLSIFTLVFELLGAVLSTAFAYVARDTVNQSGHGLGLVANVGHTYLALVWVAFAMILFIHWYWLVIWFVDFRQRSYKARRRTEDEIGNWKGIGREVMSDLRLPRRETEVDRAYINSGYARSTELDSSPVQRSVSLTEV